MLLLTRKMNESVMIGDEIEIIVMKITDGNVRIGFRVPRHIPVHREEIYRLIHGEKCPDMKASHEAQQITTNLLSGGKTG